MAALAQHVVAESPELQTLMHAAGFTSPTGRRRDDPEPEPTFPGGTLLRKRKKKHVERGRGPEPEAEEPEVGENGEPVIELKKNADGSYGPR